MAPRGNARRRQTSKHDHSHAAERPTHGSKASGSGKKTTSSSSTSKSLKEILEILNLSYDNENGLLVGDLNIPPLTTLEPLLKNLTKLNDQLEIISNLNTMNIQELESVRNSEIQETPELGNDDNDYDISRDETTNGQDQDAEEEEDEDDDIDEEHNEEEDDEDQNQNKSSIADHKFETSELSSINDITQEANDNNEHSTTANTEYKAIIPEDFNADDSSSISKTTKEFVKNPKSEFVTSQTLPTAAHALGLFTDANTLNSNGEIDLKMKYGVASYPSTDLKDKLPGEIPDIDFSKNKPANQVQFATFQTFVENFFRNFTEEDLKFLKKNYVDVSTNNSNNNYSQNVNPFLMPKLGQLYTRVWNEEEQQENYTTTIKEPILDSFKPKGSNDKLSDDALESENSISLGPLVSRLLAAVIKDNDDDNATVNSTDIDNDTITNNDDKKGSTAASLLQQQQQPVKITSVNLDFNGLEERLKAELKYIGLYNTNPDEDEGEDDESTVNGTSAGNIEDNDDEKEAKREDEPNWLNVEDDEVSQELRSLQGNLKQLIRKNNKRKRALIPIIENQLSWQEYLSILDDLDKQVDQVYLKRIKVPKNKKKKGSSTHQLPPSLQQQINNQQQMANSNIRSVLEKRYKWISKISPLFYKRQKLNDEEEKEEQEDESQETKTEESTKEEEIPVSALELSDGGYMKKHPVESVFSKINYDAVDDDDDLDDALDGKDKDKDDVLGL